MKKQERASSVVIGEELGKFGRNFKFHFNQRLKNVERSASVPPPPPKKTKTYDDIRQEIEQTIPDPSTVDTKRRKQVQFPKDAFFPGKGCIHKDEAILGIKELQSSKKILMDVK